MNIKKEKFKIVKYAMVILLICIIIELCLFIYNKSIKKLFIKYKFTENETVQLNVEDMDLISESKDYNTLKFNNVSNIKIYNIKLTLNKNFSNKVYIRVRTDYGEKLLAKSNFLGNEFNAYYKDGINTELIEIVVPSNQIEKKDIKGVLLNSNLEYFQDWNISFIRILVMYFILLGLFLIYYYKKNIFNKINNIKLEKLFLYVILVFGVVHVFINVPLINYDEHAHFWRAYEISLGNIKSNPKNEFPKTIIELFFKDNGDYPNREFNYSNLKEHLIESLNSEDKIPFAVGASGGYSIINYLFTTIGLTVGRLNNASPIFILFLGRLTNLIFYAILSYYAIKIVPGLKLKKIFGIVSILPMSVILAASYSPDAVIIGFTLLAIAYILKIKFDENIKKVNIKHFIIFTLLALIPTICKIVYIFLFGLIFIIPKEKFNKRYSKLLWSVGQIIIVFIGYYIFNIFLKGTPHTPIEKNPIEQILYCLSNPINCIGILLNTLRLYSLDYLIQMTGGWNGFNVFSLILLIILFIVTIEDTDEKEYKFSIKDKVIIGIISLIEILSVFVALYIDWSTATAPFVLGIQGRYFLPVIPLLLMIISNSEIFKINIKNKRGKFVTFICIVYLYSVLYTILVNFNIIK